MRTVKKIKYAGGLLIFGFIAVILGFLGIKSSEMVNLDKNTVYADVPGGDYGGSSGSAGGSDSGSCEGGSSCEGGDGSY